MGITIYDTWSPVYLIARWTLIITLKKVVNSVTQVSPKNIFKKGVFIPPKHNFIARIISFDIKMTHFILYIPVYTSKNIPSSCTFVNNELKCIFKLSINNKNDLFLNKIIM